MNKTKIEWCDSTWNPVTGCYHNCEYCYARRIATRFGGNDKSSTFAPYQTRWKRGDNNSGKGWFYDEASAEKPMLFVVDKPLFLPRKLDKRKTEKYGRQIYECKKAPYPFDFNPTLYRYKLDEPQEKKKPQTIFVCSMADLFGDWMPDSWIEEVFAACEKAPQHRYLFLTKNPKRYCEVRIPPADNLWFGASITKKSEMRLFNDLPAFHHRYVSMEPILEDMEPEKSNLLFAKRTCGVEWVILGAETGNRKDKVVPQREWIDAICEQADKKEVPVFMKDSLLPIVGEEHMRRELPWDESTWEIGRQQAWLDRYYEEAKA